MDVQGQVSLWPLVGRDSELKAFTSAWAERRYQGVVIFGPAGVGKSRLAQECLARAAREGWKASRASASVTAAAVPLGAIAHLIPAGVDLSDPVKGFAAVARTLAGPQRQRWALLVDDLHLIDAASTVLLRQLMDAGVVRLIGTVRTREPLSEAVQALTGGDAVHHIDLAEMDMERVEQVLRAALGAPVGRRTLTELYTGSGGNMLYLRELVLGALAAKTLSCDGEIWELSGDRPTGTPKLTELISTRLTAAGKAARCLAASAALQGDTAAAETALAEGENFPVMGLFAEEESLGEAWLHASSGRLAQARAVLTSAAETARQKGSGHLRGHAPDRYRPPRRFAACLRPPHRTRTYV
ncbi:AAA family ATPase [Streptomyces sp. NPDC015127]|uniref:AAA family ATPase n=1 Tax=Streptomyces sp. NPDC015127 TaxID=3364939 RepID=UPI0036FE4BEB